ncbi:MAG: HlyD family efflux transporter periplasmic adaptor subunit [Holosporales bacterium]|jgi:HlyD family secretion protein|nr:HlyD family efflux transporter periplasmic adaptor subunit [Holosporales bacterium]
MRSWTFFLTLLLCACHHEKEKTFDGYVEGDFLYIAPTTSGILASLPVVKGQEIHPGEKFFAIDTTNLQAALNLALAKRKNLTKGKRPAEIAMIQNQKEQVEAGLVSAQRDYNRALSLSETDMASQSDLDSKRAIYQSLKAKIQELTHSLEVAKMGARSEEIEAVDQEIAQARNNLEKAAPKAQQEGRIEDIYYHLGEFVAAGTPVLSFLPQGNIKVRFFIPNAMLEQIKLHQMVKIKQEDRLMEAKVTFISQKAEFTPPVIYSIESREKLVFMVEVTPTQPQASLHPGMPVTVVLIPYD